MFKGMTALTKAMVFTVIVLLLGFGCSQLPGVSSEAYMLTPAIAVLLMMFVITRDGYTKAGLKGLGLHKLGLRKWGFAILVPLVVQAIGYIILWATGIGSITYENLEGISPMVVIIATGSVWPAVLIHAAHNTFWARFALFTDSDSSLAEILTGDTGIFQLVLYALVAVLVIKKLKKPGVRG